ncbi:MAG: TetR/AcrR family transcriptional regulator [Actinobacteria bacterium]|nr:TetR/AcrR family transcriptional regulator [Actinomycetota bacterium]
MNYETPAATREAILVAATHMMNEVGPSGLRVAEVARVAGMTTGAIYAHFVDRQDLISAVRAAQVRVSHAEMKDHSSDRLQCMSDAITSAEPLSTSKNYHDFLMRTIVGEDKVPAWIWVKNAVAAEFDETLSHLMKGIWRDRAEEISKMLESAKSSGKLRGDTDVFAMKEIALAFYYGMAVITHTRDIDEAAAERIVASWQEMWSTFESKN